jgi:hypothetical protein
MLLWMGGTLPTTCLLLYLQQMTQTDIVFLFFFWVRQKFIRFLDFFEQFVPILTVVWMSLFRQTPVSAFDFICGGTHI